MAMINKMKSIMSSVLIRFLSMALLATLLTGCFSFSDRSFRPVRNEILQQLPGITLEKEMAISIGSLMFDLIDIIAIGVDVDISKMSSAQVAVYRVNGVVESDTSFEQLDFERTLLAKDESLRWDTIIKVREHGERVWVLAGMDERHNTLEAISVFALEQNELVLVNVNGNLIEMLEFALEPASGRRGVMSAAAI